MKKIILTIFLCILITGCPGGNRASKIKPIFINRDYLCLSVDKNDVLDFYTIYMSETYTNMPGESFGHSEVNASYPDTCLHMKWENGYTYVIHYGLNGKKYVHQFNIDKNGKQINLGEH